MSSVRVRNAALCLLAVPLLVLSGCSDVAITAGSSDRAGRERATREVALAVEAPEGYRAVSIVDGLTYPMSMTWDGDGALFVVESHAVPIPLLKPRIVRVSDDGEVRALELEGEHAPTGERALAIAHHDDWIYFSHDQADGSFAVSRVRPSGGRVEPVLRGLWTSGDHGIRSIVFDRDGSMILGIGSATNSGIVSRGDPVSAAWIAKNATAHDVPCKDVVLTSGLAAEADTLARGASARTGAFQPYGAAVATTVPGMTPCSASIARLTNDRRIDVIAWGIRNPTGLAFADDGTLLAAVEGMKERGVRPVRRDADAVFRVEEGAWYGWPDYGADLRPVSDSRHRVPAGMYSGALASGRSLIDLRKSGLEPPDPSLLVTSLESGAGVGGIAVVRGDGPFGKWAGRVLLAQSGDPAAHPERAAGGYRVDLLDPATGAREAFLRNSGSGPPRPASILGLKTGLERPIDVKIGPDGLIYVLDFGVYDASGDNPKMFPRTGRVFRVEPIGR